MHGLGLCESWLHSPMPQSRMGALPERLDHLLLLRPLTGATDEIVAIHKRLTDLIGFSFPEERVRSAKFPPPEPDDLSNIAGAHLLWQATRLTLRERATRSCKNEASFHPISPIDIIGLSAIVYSADPPRLCSSEQAQSWWVFYFPERTGNHVKYTKPALAFPDQADLVLKRGLVGPSKQAIIEELHAVTAPLGKPSGRRQRC